MIREQNMKNIVSDETRREREREREGGERGLAGYDGPQGWAQAIHCLRSLGRSVPHSENIIAMKALEGEKRWVSCRRRHTIRRTRAGPIPQNNDS